MSGDVQRRTWARGSFPVLVLGIILSAGLSAQTGWVEYANETGTRLVGASAVTTSDNAEKDYAWGDVDLDGDIDLVCVRKLAFTTGGAGAFRTNVLFMNEGGVLTDRTSEFADTSDVTSDNGFLTPTNDRDVILADVTGDGYLDIITATTLSDGFGKHISHPRIYRNLGEVAGSWAGFIHEDARMPALAGNAPGTNPPVPHAPRFCSVGAADFDEDGDLDLYFGDYDSGGSQTLDFNDRLLLNDGSGNFADATATQFSGLIVVGGNQFPFPQSAFGMAVSLEDMNGDGHVDIVKDTALNAPQFVGVAYNNPTSIGQFSAHKVSFPNMAPYHINTGDLNNDGLLDIVVTDDNLDRYLLNQGNDSNGLANFSMFNYTQAPGGNLTDGPGQFGGNNIIVDLDNDGWNDVIITDIDVDIQGCSRRTHIYHNMGDADPADIGDFVTLRQEAGDLAWRPTGVHDVAVFDVNGDGYLDLVYGTCSTTQVWINQPPEGLDFEFPQGRPDIVGCEDVSTFTVQVLGLAAGIPEVGSLEMFVSADGGPFISEPVTALGGDLYEVTLDGAQATNALRYYFSAETTGGFSQTSPIAAPTFNYDVSIGDNIEISVENFETGTNGWTVATDPSALVGGWQRVDPVGTFNGTTPVAPEDDAGPGADVLCWVTQNGAPGATAGASDLDGGPTILTSPMIDLSVGDAVISADVWYANPENVASEEDDFFIQVSNGGAWEDAVIIPGGTTNPGWNNYEIRVSEHVVPNATVRVRFYASDNPNNSLCEAGVDNFTITKYTCTGAGPLFTRGDVNSDNSIDISDAVALLQSLFGGGFVPTCEDATDANDDSQINIADAVEILSALFSGGGPLAEPTNCGTDPTDTDLLGCDTSGCP